VLPWSEEGGGAKPSTLKKKEEPSKNPRANFMQSKGGMKNLSAEDIEKKRKLWFYLKKAQRERENQFKVKKSAVGWGKTANTSGCDGLGCGPEREKKLGPYSTRGAA